MNGGGAPRILISGAAAGVGEACARLLATRGAALILSDIDNVALGRLAQELGADGRFCDVVSESSVRILAQDVALNHGSLDVLINAAGPAYVRALGLLRLSGALLPCFGVGGGRSLIVNVASGRPAIPEGSAFHHAGSPDTFSRLSLALGDRWRPRRIEGHTVLPDRSVDQVDSVAADIVARIDEMFSHCGCERRRA